MVSFSLINDSLDTLIVAVEPWAQVINLQARDRVTFAYDEPAIVDITFEAGGVVVGIASERVHISAPGGELNF